MQKLQKLRLGDKVAIVSPSFAGPGKWPHVYELGLKRLREVLGLEPVEFPTTRKLGDSREERSRDIIDAFLNPEIKAIFASLGGDDQVTYVKNLPPEPFMDNPKPFFGYSDNSHFNNFLFLNGIPSYYGSCVLPQLGMNVVMDSITVEYLKHALFDEGEYELKSSADYNDIGLNWDVPENLAVRRTYWPNDGWYWNQVKKNTEGTLWGGCIESVDEMLRHDVPIPTLNQFENIILILESSEDLPAADYVFRVMRALGERGILKRVTGVLVGRAKACEFDKQNSLEQKAEYRREQREAILRAVSYYNPNIPVVQNLDFGHTDPQIPMPYGSTARINTETKQIWASF